MGKQPTLDQPTIIISRTDNIGDVVLTLPMAKILKQHWPNCKILFLARDYTQAIIEAYPAVDQFISWDTLSQLPRKKAVKQLMTYQATDILHVFPRKEIAKLALYAKIPQRIGTSHRWYHWLYCNKMVRFSRRNSSLHEAQLNLSLLRAFDINTEYNLSEIKTLIKLERPQSSKAVNELIDPNRFNLIIHPGSNGNGREWPTSSFIQFMQKLDPQQFHVMITGSDKEALRFANLTQQCSGAKNLMGQLTLQELLNLMALSNGLIASSTGPLHMAAALGIHCLGLYPPQAGISPTRWGPIGEKAEVLVTDKLCPGCTSSNDCACLPAISVTSVLQHIQAWQQQLSCTATEEMA